MINFSKQLFGEDIEVIKVADLEAFFDGERDESTKVEAKSFVSPYGDVGEGLKAVIISICAFLNSNGGIVVWGAPIEVDKKFEGGLTSVPKMYEKDKLISIISDKITPLPVGVKMERIEKIDGYIYIFEIQESPYSPHQVYGKYWARLDGQTRVAPHYLVEALFKKITYPNIEGYINLLEFKVDRKGMAHLKIDALIFNFSELQNEEGLSIELISDYGQFVEFYSSGKFDNSGDFKDGARWRVNNAGIIHFGVPIIENLTLKFPLNEFKDDTLGEMRLLLTFGGKHSPMKTSSYFLKFSGSIAEENPKLFTKIVENEAMHENWVRFGRTRETTLNAFIKR